MYLTFVAFIFHIKITYFYAIAYFWYQVRTSLIAYFPTVHPLVRQVAAYALLELTNSLIHTLTEAPDFFPRPLSANQVIDPECPTSGGITTFPRRNPIALVPHEPSPITPSRL